MTFTLLWFNARQEISCTEPLSVFLSQQRDERLRSSPVPAPGPLHTPDLCLVSDDPHSSICNEHFSLTAPTWQSRRDQSFQFRWNEAHYFGLIVHFAVDSVSRLVIVPSERSTQCWS
jgi:hypothetical protein